MRQGDLIKVKNANGGYDRYDGRYAIVTTYIPSRLAPEKSNTGWVSVMFPDTGERGEHWKVSNLELVNESR